MATLNFNGTTQYVEFSTLAAAIQNLPTGPQTLLALQKPSALGGGVFRSTLGVANSALSAMLAHWGFSAGPNQRADLSRVTADGAAYSDTTNWGMHFETLDTADTNDVQFHTRNHTADGAFTQTNGSSNPGYGSAVTSGGFIQIGRWLTSDLYAGDIALVALWNRKLSNAQRDELYANDRTSDVYNVTGGPPIFLVEFNVAESSLVNIGTAAATRSAPAAAPTLTGGNPDRWTFDGVGGGVSLRPAVPITFGSGAGVDTREILRPLAGTVSKNATTTVTGVGTSFLTELVPGLLISVPGGASTERRVVSAIASDTSLTVTAAFTTTASTQVGSRIDNRQIVQESTTKTPAISTVASATSDTTLLASNRDRIGAVVYNNSTANLFIKYGSGASATSYTVKVSGGGFWEMPPPRYTGQVNGIWSAANGSAIITEMTP